MDFSLVRAEFDRLLIMAATAQIELVRPPSRHEGRDNEIHLRGEVGSCLAVQVKA